MIPRQAVALIAFLSLAPVVQAQGGLSDMFRSVTGALRGQPEPAPQPKGVTATIGVRGMDEAEAKGKTAAPASGDYAQMEAWAATRTEAESAAARKGLAARQVTLRAKDAQTAPANN